MPLTANSIVFCLLYCVHYTHRKKVPHKIQTKIFVVLQVSCQWIPRYCTFSLYLSYRVADSWLDFPFGSRKKWITFLNSILHFTMTMIDSRYRPQREQIKQLRFFHSYDACIFGCPGSIIWQGLASLGEGGGGEAFFKFRSVYYKRTFRTTNLFF